MARYYKCADGSIYKERDKSGDYLKVTPWEKGEDRRKKFEDLDSPQLMPKRKTLETINDIWRNTTFRWTYNNKKYETRGHCYDHIDIGTDRWKRYVKPLELSPDHLWHHISDYVDRNGIKRHHEYDNTYKLVMYQGKLIWVCMSQYFPQFFYYQFESIDKEPRIWGGWTNINCIKPVFCITDKKYI